MLFPIKRVLSKYWTLVLKMHQDVNIVNQVAHNLESFCDLEVMVELFGIMPLLEGLNELIKFSPNLDNVLYVILLLG
jgi:hypothetical protein